MWHSLSIVPDFHECFRRRCVMPLESKEQLRANAHFFFSKNKNPKQPHPYPNTFVSKESPEYPGDYKSIPVLNCFIDAGLNT